MELRQLEYFVAVAEEASFTRAAARLHVAQPGVSAQVAKLESELGQRLLKRTTRSVRLTDVGESVLAQARAALAGAQGVRDAVSAHTGLLQGRVVVGTVPSSGVRALPDALATFNRAHPGVELRLREGRADALLDELAAGGLDLAVAGVAGDAVPHGIATQTVIEDDLTAAVGRSHPLARAGRRTITLHELAALPLVCLPPGSGIRTALDRALAAAGLTATAALEAGDPLVVADLAARGLGVAVLPQSLVRSRPEALHPLRLRGAGPIGGRVVLAWRADAAAQSPAGRALVEHARAALATG